MYLVFVDLQQPLHVGMCIYCVEPSTHMTVDCVYISRRRAVAALPAVKKMSQ